MGLDMYLEAEQYLSNWSHSTEAQRGTFRDIVERAGMSHLVNDDTTSGSVSIKVGYWRKANAVHQWFVNNCQGGKDDCQRSYVSSEQLEQLRDLCKLVITHKGDEAKTREMLPPAHGFFFGSFDIDDWYYEGLEQTIGIMDRALAMADVEIYYRASW